jgi:hypothetical protein
MGWKVRHLSIGARIEPRSVTGCAPVLKKSESKTPFGTECPFMSKGSCNERNMNPRPPFWMGMCNGDSFDNLSKVNIDEWVKALLRDYYNTSSSMIRLSAE